MAQPLEQLWTAVQQLLRRRNTIRRQVQLHRDRLQCRRHLVGVGEALRGVAGGGLGDECVEFGRHATDEVARRGHIVLDPLVGHRQRVVAGERHPPGEQFEDQDAEGVHVAAGVRGAGGDLLGGEVGGGAEDHAGGGGVGRGHGADQAEVGDLHLARVGDQHVLRLHVAVHQAGVVGGADRAQHRLGHGRARRAAASARVRAAARAACRPRPIP